MLKQLVIVVLLAVVWAIPTAAQDTTVTADDVNEVAEKMYCPVCENIPLEDCGTAACQDWRDEIRIYLEQGWTEEQIINDFIDRFGDMVVGVPRNPLLRGMSLITPWVLITLLLAFVVNTFYRKQPDTPMPQAASDDHPDDLRAQLERDLNS